MQSHRNVTFCGFLSNEVVHYVDMGLETTDKTYLQIQGRRAAALGAVQADGTIKLLATFERLTSEEVEEIVELIQLGIELKVALGG